MQRAFLVYSDRSAQVSVADLQAIYKDLKQMQLVVGAECIYSYTRVHCVVV